MSEKKFGETPIFGESWFERISSEMKAKGFEYQGIENLAITKLDEDGKFKEFPEQTLEKIKEKYEKLGTVEIVRDPENKNSIFIFLKSK